MVSVLLLTLATLVPTASAKDLNGRVGLGFSQQFGGSGAMSALSLRYGLPTGKPTTNLGVELDVGVDVADGATDFFGGGRFLWGEVAEDNMNLNLGLGAGYLQRNVILVGTDGTTTEATPYGTVRLQPSIGAEFFLFGLENLGFTAELGMNLDIVNGGVQVLTVGGAPGVGMHYYF